MTLQHRNILRNGFLMFLLVSLSLAAGKSPVASWTFDWTKGGDPIQGYSKFVPGVSGTGAGPSLGSRSTAGPLLRAGTFASVASSGSKETTLSSGSGWSPPPLSESRSFRRPAPMPAAIPRSGCASWTPHPTIPKSSSPTPSLSTSTTSSPATTIRTTSSPTNSSSRSSPAIRSEQTAGWSGSPRIRPEGP